MAHRRLLIGLLVSAASACGERVPDGSKPASAVTATAERAEPGSSACRGCHEKIVDSFVQTAHFKTSAQADTTTIKRHFAAGHDQQLRTARPDTWFKMEHVGGVFYQTGFSGATGRSRTERMELVVGSGRVGQSYLYWKDGALLQLPVSYLTGVDAWINSPGYRDGQVDFDRVIPGRCLECHSTYFTPAADRNTPRYSGDYMLGISCAKCHAGGRQHIEYQSSHPAGTRARFVVNPSHFTRERKLDNCALCHSGARQPTAAPFTYRAGDTLDKFFAPQTEAPDSVPDVHGNQVGLLRRSRCFRSSPDMSCSTCHNVHEPQRDVTRLAQRCLTCHTASKHPQAERIGDRLMTKCIDCHMPNQTSRLIRINTPSGQFSPTLRSHLIGIYPALAEKLLQH